MTTLALAAALTREWDAMNRRPSALDHIRRWDLPRPVQSLDDLLDLTGRRPGMSAAGGAGEARVAEACRADRALAQLVTLAATDPLAGRVVLQRLLPGLIRRAMTWSRRHHAGLEGAFDELVAAAWLAIDHLATRHNSSPTAPAESRQVAARLLRDAEYRAFVSQTRRRWTANPVPPIDLDLPYDPESEPDEPLLALADAVASVRAALTAEDLRILSALMSHPSTAEVAAAHGVSVRSVRNYRQAAVARLRSALAA